MDSTYVFYKILSIFLPLPVFQFRCPLLYNLCLVLCECAENEYG